MIMGTLAARFQRLRVRDERGSISLFAIVAVVAILVILGLVVDGGALALPVLELVLELLALVLEPLRDLLAAERELP